MLMLFSFVSQHLAQCLMNHRLLSNNWLDEYIDEQMTRV